MDAADGMQDAADGMEGAAESGPREPDSERPSAATAEERPVEPGGSSAAEGRPEAGAFDDIEVPPPPGPRRPRPLWRRITRRTLLGGLTLLVLVSLAVSQTREGQELVVNAILDRVRGALAGELVVGGVRSGTLLTGASLTDVRLDAADGRPFLRADSVVLRYSLPAALTGGTPIRSTTLWGVRVEISSYDDDDPLNVTRLLADRPAGSAGSADAPRAIDLGRIGIREGHVEVLTPAERGSTAPTVSGPDGQALRRLAFEDLDLDVEGALLRPGGEVEFEARLASLSASVFLRERPLVVREAFGRVSYGTEGIRVQEAALRLPSTLLRGALALGPARPDAPWTFRTDLEVDAWGDLGDLQWIDARIPPGRFRGSAAIEVPDAVEVSLDGLEVELEASSVTASGWARFDDVLALRSMEVTAGPLAVERLEPWLGADVPLDGWLSGQATFSGTLLDLGATGRLTLVPTGYGGGATTADFNGVVHRGDNPGASDLQLRLEPFNYSILQAFWPDAPFAGPGSGLLELHGRADQGLVVVADFEHALDSASTSRAAVRGLARRLEDGSWVTDLRGDLIPLSIASLDRLAPEIGLQGSLEGPLTVSGRLDDLAVTADLGAREGRVLLDARVDLTSPGSRYRLSAEADRLPLGELSSELPERSAWTGLLELEGEGLALDSMDASATLVASASRIGSVGIDTVAAAVRVERGVLVTDTLVATVGGIDVDGRGRFGLAEGAWGSARFAFEAETLVGLRPLVMGVGDTILVRDGLGDLDRQFLRATGVDPDTLPTEADVRMEGAVRGAVSVSGGARSFDLGVVVDVANGAYRHNQVDTARLALTATDLPGTQGTWGVGASARGVVFQDRTFDQGGVEAQMSERVGSGRIELVRTADEQYRVAGSFRLGESDGEVALESAQVRIGPASWDLTGATRVAWDERSVTVDSLSVVRLGEDPMRLVADGTLTRGGQSDFHVDLDGLHVERLIHVGQLSGIDMSGHVDLEVDVTGPSETPRIEGSFRVNGPRYGMMQLSRIEGSLEYEDRTAVFSVLGWDGARDALDVTARVPADLALATVEERLLDEPMDVRLSVDSLDAAIALSYLSTLEQVVGSVSGEIVVGGTPRDPEPEGHIVLSGAEWSIPEIGVRHTDVNGRLTVSRDRAVDVQLSSSGQGSSTVAGVVSLRPLSDPTLDLTFTFDRFQAVERIDVEGLVSGAFDLEGTYSRPVATGALTVDQASIYVDEFQRVAGVVDLSDPLLFERGLGVDTTALLAQPLVAGLRNPFFDNLRVDIDLAVPRDTWLRSIETNVEMSGDLLVAYDRRAADLVLIGELEAVRGSHLVLGRTFDLDGGTVSFIGRPGMNPNLDIDASTRVFRRAEDALQVSAHVGGTLIRPVVTLSTDEVGTSESDIVSYLIFGQATTELGSNQADVFGQASENVRTGTLTYFSGALANQFGAALARGIGLDYLSVQLGTSSTGTSGPLGGRAQFEFGRYLGNDLFAVLVFRRSGDEVENVNFLGGARVEWALTDDYHVEGFLEDRFLRSGAAGFALPGLLEDNRVVGVFVFRDWGY